MRHIHLTVENLLVCSYRSSDPISKLVRQVFHPKDDEVEVVVVGCPRPRGRSASGRCLGGHNSLDQGVGAVEVAGVAVLTHGTGHETQVLEQQQLTVRIEAIQCFEPVGKDFVTTLESRIRVPLL